MAEDAEFAQFVTQAVTEITAPAEAPKADAPPADTPKVEPAAAKDAEPAKPVEAKEEPKPETKPEPAWKIKAAEEKAKREARNASKGNEAQLKAQLAAVEAEVAEWRAFQAAKDKDPLGAAEKLGLSYDRLTKEYIRTLDPEKPQTAPEVTELRQKIQQVETLLQQQQQTIAQRAQAEAMQSFKAEVGQILQAKGDDFEHVKAHPQGLDLVREIVGAHFRATATWDKDGKTIIAPGEVMDTEEACGRAEEWIQGFLGNFKGTKTFAPKVEAKAEEKPAPKKPEAPTLSQDLRTGGTKSEPHGDEVEQLLALKKTLEAQLNASAGN